MKILTAIFAALILAVLVGGGVATATAERNGKSSETVATYQGKTMKWWANRAVANRKSINAKRLKIQSLKKRIELLERRQTSEIKRLTKSLKTEYTVAECVKLATIAYPSLSEERAWAIVAQESRGDPKARNRTPIWNGEHAEGLWQFIPSTFASTPYGKAGLSIWSPCASSLAAGWMHEQGRGHEWEGF